MRLSEPTTKIWFWMKIEPYYRRQKCRLMKSSFRRYKICANIREGYPGRGSQTTVGLSTTAIFSIFDGYFPDTLETSPALLYRDMQSVVDFSVIPKCMTLNDPDWLFRVKFCFRASLAGWDRATLENNCVKTNKDRLILSAVQIFGRESSLWQYKVCADIRSGSLVRRR